MGYGKMHEKVCAVDDTSLISSLSADATVWCGKCGAKAHNPENVCDPIQLPEPGTFAE